MKIIFLIFFYLSLNAEIKNNMFILYQNEKYEKACNLGYGDLNENTRDEEFMSLYAFACLKSDYIDRLSIPIALLKSTKESRSNAAYFSVILMQKKLLYHALVDGYDLSVFKLPTTNYVLSKIFDLYSKLAKHETRSIYLFEDEENSKITYKLYLENNDRLSKMIIEVYYDTISVQRHVYW
ncbi:MAG: hypothetical protein L3I99_01495 [Sulfurimonas sp.]|nr:hypothetical protein [Sulfurimonas sp.]